MKKAIEYRRISTSDQSNFSLSGQGAINQKYALAHQIEITKIFIDDGVSGKNFDRPQWKLLVKELKKKNIDYVIVSKYDRLGRNAGEALAQLQQIEESTNIRVLSALEHFHIDPSSPFYFKMRADMLVNADFERRVIKDRTLFGMYQGKSEGRYLRNAPFGYKNARDNQNKPIIVPDDHRANIIKNIFTNFANGMSLAGVKKTANSEGFTLRAKLAIHRVLTNHIYIGKIIVPAYLNEPPKIINGIHEALIDEATFLRAQNLLFSKPQKHILQRDELPLRGWLLCPCGKTLTGAKSKSKTGAYHWYYRCNYCKPAISHNAKKVESDMIEILKSLSLDKKIIDDVINEIIVLDEENRKTNVVEIKQLKTKIAENNDKLESLEDKYISDKIEESTYKKWKTNYLQQLHLAIDRLNLLEQSNSKMLSILLENRDVLTNLSKLFENSTTQNKVSVLNAVFNSNLTIYKTHYETLNLNPIFQDNALNTNMLQIKKDGISTVFSAEIQLCTLGDAIMKLIATV